MRLYAQLTKDEKINLVTEPTRENISKTIFKEYPKLEGNYYAIFSEGSGTILDEVELCQITGTDIVDGALYMLKDCKIEMKTF